MEHIVYVDAANEGGPWDGHSWATAFGGIHEGLDAAEAMVATAAVRPQVWVARGIYKPSSGADRDATFRLRRGVDLIGGFHGDETAPEQRDWKTHATVLSGAVGAREEEGSLHVVTGADDAVLDGFTICGGFNFPGGPPPHHMSPATLLSAKGAGVGAGILCAGCAPTVRHCVIRDNVAAKGAGMYNLATREWPTDGARPAPAVMDCTFLRNHSRARGGAVCNDLMTHATFVDCSFVDNRCDAKGGAMYNDFDCSPTLVSCLFAGNVADKGGGMANDGRSSPVLTNCTFTRNHATAMYGALYNGTGPTNVPNAPVVANCIFWADTADSGPAEIGDWHDCLTAVTYSCVEGGHAGEGNIDADPRFVDPGHGDFRLGPGSPCVDNGHGGAAPPADRDGNARFDDAGCPAGPFARVPHFPPGAHLPEPSMEAGFQAPVDMGAYERQERSADPVAPRVVFVNVENREGPWDGRSWATAFTDLQEALRVAYLGAEEVWVAAGEYHTTPDGDRRRSFRLLSGLALYGGFAGTEERRDQRDWKANETILSGGLGSPLGEAGNAYHVVLGADGAVLDGFTVADGCADGAGIDGHGAGLLCYNAVSPAVANCRFSRLRARDGGAVYAYNLSSPSFEACDFIGCHADSGGAAVVRVGSRPLFRGCRFIGDSARWRAGAVQIDYGSGPSFVECFFESCSSGGHGGALFLESVAAQIGVIGTTVDACTFVGNSAALRGGAIGAADASEPVITGCTFTANCAASGGGAISADERVTVTVRGCVFRENDGGSGDANVDADELSTVLRDDGPEAPGPDAVPSKG
jgi:predicted outer membrane repeat protein